MELENRWLRAWIVISFDTLLGLHGELWLDRETTESFGAVARNRLMTARSDGFVDRAELSYELVVAFSKEFGPRKLSSLASWVEDVSVWSGSDRVAEATWAILVYRLFQQLDESVTIKVKTAIRNVVEFHRTRKQEALEQLSQVMASGFGAEERTILERYQISRPHLEDSLALTIGCNTFVAAWESYCSELASAELRALQEAGQSLANTLGMGPAQVGFPGFWRPRLRSFLDNLAKGPNGAEK